MIHCALNPINYPSISNVQIVVFIDWIRIGSEKETNIIEWQRYAKLFITIVPYPHALDTDHHPASNFKWMKWKQ